MIKIHPTADVSEKSKIGEGTLIWHQAQVREGTNIGKNCIIGKGVYIDKNVNIGNNCKFQNYSCVFHGVRVDDGVFVGPGTLILNDKYPRAITIEGKLKSDTDWEEKKTLIKEGASLGAGSVVLPGIIVGRFALVGAGSVISKDVLDFALVYGIPNKQYGWVCKCGERLRINKKKIIRCLKCKLRYKFVRLNNQKIVIQEE